MFRSVPVILACVSLVPGVMAQRQPVKGTLHIVVALVGDELQVRPVPLLQLSVQSVSDTSRRCSLRTGLDGTAVDSFPPGAYHLSSVRPAVLGGRSFAWSLDIRVESSRSTRIELTNANADSTTSPVTGRQLAPEVGVYDRVKRGVLRVNAGLAHGSGFMLDTLGGVLITNEHVVSGGQTLSVTIDSLLRVPARVVVTDHDADLAVVAFDPAACSGCPRLRLAGADSSGAFVVPGERVIAVGFPLSQQSTITSGIVSSVREHAIISDVNINHGNSGGPLLNLDGLVVGINTFGESDRQGGPGVSGSVSISRLAPLLRRAQDTLKYIAYPEPRPLPVISGPPFALTLIRSTADSAFEREYQALEFALADFRVRLGTPVSQFVTFRVQEDEISRDRRKREQRAGLSQEQRYSEFREFHDWIQYVGDLTTPAVTFEITPKIGETTGSIFARVLVSSNLQAKMVFKGDFHDAYFYRNGEPIVPVVGGRAPQTVYEENQWVVMKDVAYRGYYILPIETFAPDSQGVPPSIVVRIDDLKHYDRLILRELKPEAVARVWNDFAPYFAAVRPGVPFTWADASKFSSDFSARCNASALCSGMQRFERTPETGHPE